MGERKIGQLACMMSFNDRHPFWINGETLVDARLYDIYTHSSIILPLAISLNSSFTPLIIELTARANLGEGALDFKVYEAANLPIVLNNIKIIPSYFYREALSIFEEMKQADRKTVDNIIFETLLLTQGEREAVYEAVIDLVEARLNKAGSLNK